MPAWLGFQEKQERALWGSEVSLPTAQGGAEGLSCRGEPCMQFGERGAFLPSSAFPLAASFVERCLRGS